MTQKNNKKIGVMPIGILLTTLLSIWLGWTLLEGDKRLFTSGDTSFGHYQIEIACKTCHGDPFSDAETMQAACESCHLKALKKADDSHPRSVFVDPANHQLLDKIDATQCVSCHREHKPEITRDFGVTLAKDFCFECHQDIGKERASHQNLSFDSCSNSGCHNYHNNSMLYEKFLRRHLNEPPLLSDPKIAKRNALQRWLKKKKNQLLSEQQLTQATSRFKQQLIRLQLNQNLVETKVDDIISTFKKSIHAKTGSECIDCHQAQPLNAKTQANVCKTCHKKTVQGFIAGHHGMMLNIADQTLSPIQSKSHMKMSAREGPNCSSCHDPHQPDLIKAAVEACYQCHDSDHVRSYKNSRHYQSWLTAVAAGEPQEGVSCASCHLPRIKRGKWVSVEHNQSSNLRPPVKMLRTVCMQCHGLDFSLAALADQRLRKNNFIGQPTQPHPTTQLLLTDDHQGKKSQSQTNSQTKSQIKSQTDKE